GHPTAPPAVARDESSAATPSKILADVRTNTLIVVTGAAGYDRVKVITDWLHQPGDNDGGAAVHVYALENALAEELAGTLTAALGQGAAKTATTPANAAKPGSSPVAPTPI